MSDSSYNEPTNGQPINREDVGMPAYDALTDPTVQGNPAISTGSWLRDLIICIIPIINVIMLLIWSFSDNINPDKRSFARAALILVVALMLVGIILMIWYLSLHGSSSIF